MLCLGQEIPPSPEYPPLKSSMIKSALIPGLGEFGLGKNSRGRLFTQIELVLWITLSGSKRAVSLHESKLHSFASEHAGVTLKGKSNQFYIDIGNFGSMDLFNEAHQRSRQPSQTYSDRARFNWEWDKGKNRQKYRRFRIQRDTARMVGQFIIGGLVLNRIISLIDIRYLYQISSNQAKISFTPSWNRENFNPQITLIYLL